MKPSLVIFSAAILAVSVSVSTFEDEFLLSPNNGTFESKTYFDVNDEPMLANGHIGYVPFTDSIYMNGLYNGFTKTSSHRARIPNFANIYFDGCGPTTSRNNLYQCSYTLDAQRALFRTTAQFLNGNVTVEHIQYAHRYFNRVIVNTIKMKRIPSAANVTFQLALNRDWNGWSEDLEMNDMINGVISKRKIVLLAATTQIVEDPIYQSKRSKVFILYERIPKTIRFRRRKNTASFTWLTMVQNEKDGIEDLFQYLHANAHDLLKTHTIEWNNFWSEHGISVDGNAELSKSIQSSLYAIASNLPSLRSFSSNEPFYGLSSCGLGSGGPKHEGYEGHSLWDSETWLLPSILLIEPKWSQELLKYRHNVREAARQHANNTGFQGLRFPWHSAFTGVETSPKKFLQNGYYAHHITADVGNAVKSVFYATHDLQWMRDYGCDLALGTAEFWASRVTFNESLDHYEIKGVIGPGNDYKSDNNLYTNVAAAMNLFFGTYASCICHNLNASKYNLRENWQEIARNIQIVEESSLNVILLNYPLRLRHLDSKTLRYNLETHESTLKSNGSAMAWSMHAIGYLDVGMTPTPILFNQTFAPFVRKPFYVWNEHGEDTPSNASNFLAGAGGFLQMIMYGYAGIRIRGDALTIRRPTLPPGATVLKLKGISYMGLRFKLEIATDVYRITLRGDTSNIRFYVDGNEQDVSIKKAYLLDQPQTVKIQPKDIDDITTCSVPKDIIK